MKNSWLSAGIVKMAIGNRVRVPQVVTASALYLLALVGIGVFAYGVHEVRVWRNDGVWCPHKLDQGGTVRRYGNACELKPKRSSPKLLT